MHYVQVRLAEALLTKAGITMKVPEGDDARQDFVKAVETQRDFMRKKFHTFIDNALTVLTQPEKPEVVDLINRFHKTEAVLLQKVIDADNAAMAAREAHEKVAETVTSQFYSKPKRPRNADPKPSTKRSATVAVESSDEEEEENEAVPSELSPTPRNPVAQPTQVIAPPRAAPIPVPLPDTLVISQTTDDVVERGFPAAIRRFLTREDEDNEAQGDGVREESQIVVASNAMAPRQPVPVALPVTVPAPVQQRRINTPRPEGKRGGKK